MVGRAGERNGFRDCLRVDGLRIVEGIAFGYRWTGWGL